MHIIRFRTKKLERIILETGMEIVYLVMLVSLNGYI